MFNRPTLMMKIRKSFVLLLKVSSASCNKNIDWLDLEMKADLRLMMTWALDGFPSWTWCSKLCQRKQEEGFHGYSWWIHQRQTVCLNNVSVLNQITLFKRIILLHHNTRPISISDIRLDTGQWAQSSLHFLFTLTINTLVRPSVWSHFLSVAVNCSWLAPADDQMLHV